MSMTQTQQHNVPALRFSEFSGEWSRKFLGDVGTIIRGASPRPKGDKRFYGGSVPRLMVQDVTRDGKYVTPSIDFLTEAGADRSRPCKAGTLTVVCSGTVGVPSILAIDACIHDGFLAFRDIESDCSIDFLYTHLSRLQSKFDASATHGGVFVNLTTTILKEFEIAIPPLPEQKKIASFLSSVDRKIEQLGKKKALLEQYKKGMMQKLFSQELRFKDAQGNDFPDWEEKRLGDVFSEVTEKVGSRELETYSITAGRGFVSQKEKFGRDISGRQNEKYTCLNNGQFSYNKGNSKTYKYGCVYLNNTGKQIAVPNVFISFELLDRSMSAFYFAKLFEHHHLDRGLRRIISSSARMDGLLNVNKKYFFKLTVPVPSAEEQRKIADFLSSIDRKIDLVSTELDYAKSFKKGLLQQMFI